MAGYLWGITLGTFASVSQSNPLRLALLSVDPETGSGIPILLLTFSSLALSPSFFSLQMWPLLQHSQATAQPWENLCPCLKPGRKGNFSALAENWSFVMLKHWHRFCCDFVLHFDVDIIQSIWHRTGENENTRKPIPRTINFISKSALQNGRGERFFFILLYSPNYAVTS